jgi:hypothetical protein
MKIRKRSFSGISPKLRPDGSARTQWLVVGLLALVGSFVQAQVPTLVMTPRWSIATSNRWDLDAANLTRGVAINKQTGNVLLASRVGTNHIAVLNGADGSELGYLASSEMTGGTLHLVHVRVADDGVIYAANLAGSASGFKIYRWDSEAEGMVTEPYVAFGPQAPGASSQRYGDAMDVRGAGTNTQIVVSGSGSSVFSIFTTEDGTNFTATEISHGLGAGELGKALSFDGTNNVIYGKKEGSPNLHKVAFDLTAAKATLLTNVVVPSSDNSLVGVKTASSNGVDFAVGPVYGTHRFKAYNIGNPGAPALVLDAPFTPPNYANGNGVGASDIGSGFVVGLDVNNGLLAYNISFATTVPPTIVSQPADATNVLAGGYVTFAVGASGTAPLRYQWKFNGTNDVLNATNSTLTLRSVTLADAGAYHCVVSNAVGGAVSSPAMLAVLPSVLSAASEPLWSKSAGELFFLGTDNNCRGMAFNPVTGHVIVVSRTPTNGVHVVDAATGAYLASLDLSGVDTALGTFAVNLCGVADDGAIYVANLDTSGVNYTIYRWADENPSTVASVAFGPGDPAGAGRMGDTFAVRGAGTDTQLLAASRDKTLLALFTTADGVYFTPNVIDTAPEPAGLAGLGVAFGGGATFWTKTSGIQFRQFAFDLAAQTNVLLRTFAAGQATGVAFGVDPVNNLLATIVPNYGTTGRPAPLHIDLYDVDAVLDGQTPEPMLIDEDFFPTQVVNGNGTGAVAFDVKGGRLFALDTNNGLLALKTVARLQVAQTGQQMVFSWVGPSVLQSASDLDGPWENVTPAGSPHTHTIAGTTYFRLKR